MDTKPQKLLTTPDVIAVLAKSVAGAGSQAQWCDDHAVSTAYVSDVLNGRRDPGKKILNALGYEAVTRYRAKT